MFLLAASAGFAIAASLDVQVGRLGPREQQIWKRMEPSIVTVLMNGRPSGAAALIDASGLFVAHRNAVMADRVQARMSDGRTIQLSVRGQDALAQLVLLQASDWNSNATPLSAPVSGGRPGGTLLAVLPNGPIRAEHVASRYGVVKPSNRLVPLAEVRFEAPATEVGTALVFSENMEILGALNATLGRPDSTSNPLGNNLRDPGGIFGKVAPIGPSELTVAYTTGPQLIRRVIAGFKSPSHEVAYPSLGVMCSDAIGGGAQVMNVIPGSPAAQAGVRYGDIIADIGGVLVQNQVDFARVMLDQEIGKRITVRLKRGSQIMFLNAVVAKAD